MALCLCLATLLPGSTYLMLTNQRFTFSVLYRRTFVAWEHVRDIRVSRIQGFQLVVWSRVFWSGEMSTSRFWSGIFKRIHGADAWLPNVYAMSSEAISTLMNAVLCRSER